MKRREFITALGGAAVTLRGAAQPAERGGAIGWNSSRAADDRQAGAPGAILIHGLAQARLYVGKEPRLRGARRGRQTVAVAATDAGG